MRTPIGTITFNLYDKEDYKHCLKIIKKAQLRQGFKSNGQALVWLCSEWDETYPEELEELEHAEWDDVTRHTLIRDRFECVVPGCNKLRRLDRHSHLHSHSKAQVQHCLTLCREHHDQYHNEKAQIVLTEALSAHKRAKIRWIKK